MTLLLQPHEFATYVIALGRLLLAALLSAAIGTEREFRGRPAGVRTHMLVGIGACLLSEMDFLFAHGTGARIAAQVVTGVGFLGAGTILRSDEGKSVQGLTTAASIWATAALGIAVGFGGAAAWVAATTAVVVLITLTQIAKLEDFLLRTRRNRNLVVVMRSSETSDPQLTVAHLIHIIVTQGIKVQRAHSDPLDPESRTQVIQFELRLPKGDQAEANLIKALNDDPEMVQHDWVQ